MLRPHPLRSLLAASLVLGANACSPTTVERSAALPPEAPAPAVEPAPAPVTCEGLVPAEQSCPLDTVCPPLLVSDGCGDVIAATDHWILTGDHERSFMHYRGPDVARRDREVESLYGRPGRGWWLAQGGDKLWVAHDAGLSGSFTHGLLTESPRLKDAEVAGIDFVTVPGGNTLQLSRFRILWQKSSEVVLKEIPSDYGPQTVAECERVLGTSLTAVGTLTLCQQGEEQLLRGDIYSKPFDPLPLRDFEAGGVSGELVSFQIPHRERDEGRKELWRRVDDATRDELMWTFAIARASRDGIAEPSVLVAPRIERDCAEASCPVKVRHLVSSRLLWARGDDFVLYELRAGRVDQPDSWRSEFRVARLELDADHELALHDRASWQLPPGERCPLGQVSIDRQSGRLRIPCGKHLWVLRALNLPRVVPPPPKPPPPQPPPPPPKPEPHCGANPDISFCGGRCVHTRHNRDHCGSCGVTCNRHMACIDGACRGAVCTDARSCPAGWTCGNAGGGMKRDWSDRPKPTPVRPCQESNDCRRGERCVHQGGHGICLELKRCEPCCKP